MNLFEEVFDLLFLYPFTTRRLKDPHSPLAVDSRPFYSKCFTFRMFRYSFYNFASKTSKSTTCEYLIHKTLLKTQCLRHGNLKNCCFYPEAKRRGAISLNSISTSVCVCMWHRVFQTNGAISMRFFLFENQFPCVRFKLCLVLSSERVSPLFVNDVPKWFLVYDFSINCFTQYNR